MKLRLGLLAILIIITSLYFLFNTKKAIDSIQFEIDGKKQELAMLDNRGKIAGDQLKLVKKDQDDLNLISIEVKDDHHYYEYLQLWAENYELQISTLEYGAAKQPFMFETKVKLIGSKENFTKFISFLKDYKLAVFPSELLFNEIDEENISALVTIEWFKPWEQVSESNK
jgi:hypothetical protein